MAYMPKTKVKSLGKLMVDYIRISAETGVHDPELEALREFFGKKGQMLKRPLRSKKQQAKFEKAVKAAKEKYGNKPSKGKMKKEMQRRKEAAEAKKEKATKTFRKRKVKEAKESGGKKNFRSEAQKARKRYSTMMDAFMDEAIAELMRAYNIGSDIIEYLAEQGLTVEQIKAFLEQFTARINDMPQEAMELAGLDDIFQIFKDLNDNYSDSDFNDISEMFGMALDAMEEGIPQEYVNDLIDIWQDAGGADNMAFSQFREEMAGMEDPYNLDTAREVVGYDN